MCHRWTNGAEWHHAVTGQYQDSTRTLCSDRTILYGVARAFACHIDDIWHGILCFGFSSSNAPVVWRPSALIRDVPVNQRGDGRSGVSVGYRGNTTVPHFEVAVVARSRLSAPFTAQGGDPVGLGAVCFLEGPGPKLGTPCGTQ
ncbi:hypothetical protein DPEC_G00241800 [Dallia pectoralis]|uniref:Uncharacterized protein n=1 Tax=Dallia pectoralis TaxID=75939 RepID=A0ACC2FV19_DALPE|nr:hypothetical protein DPEC_G00241800 [Dallia pectoralis]